MILLIKLGYVTERYKYEELVENYYSKLDDTKANKLIPKDINVYDSETTRSRADSLKTSNSNKSLDTEVIRKKAQDEKDAEKISKKEVQASKKAKSEILKMLNIKDKKEEFSFGIKNSSANSKVL